MIQANEQFLQIVGTSCHEHEFVCRLYAFCIRSFHTIVVEQTAKNRFLGEKDKTGSVTAGKFADIIAIEGNPLQDVTLLEKVKFVMKDRTVYKN